jgi:hypothetical protein
VFASLYVIDIVMPYDVGHVYSPDSRSSLLHCTAIYYTILHRTTLYYIILHIYKIVSVIMKFKFR